MPRRVRPVSMILAALFLVPGAGCKDGSPTEPEPDGDETPPAAVADLSVQSVVGSTVTVAWTSPGDDGNEGCAGRYDVRWSSAPITAGTWAAATTMAGVPTPADAGTAQTAAFDAGGASDAYVALKTADEVPNWSALSNVASATLAADELFVVHQLTTSGDHKHPHVDNGVIVWVGNTYDGTGEDIFLYDIEDHTYPITRKTHSGGQKKEPTNVDRIYMVWQGRDLPTQDWEIHTCASTGPCALTQFTDNGLYDYEPAVMNTNRFVWNQSTGFYSDIRFFDDLNGTDISLSDACCPSDAYSNSRLEAEGDWVVWRSTDGSVTQFATWMKNVMTGVLLNVSAVVDDNVGINFSLDDGELAFESAEVIKYWDRTTVHEIAPGQYPSLSEGRIAYLVWAGDWDIHYWDGSTIHEIAVEQYDEAQVCLDGDWLVWMAKPDGGDGQIFYMRVRN